jgi:hypothetical protein
MLSLRNKLLIGTLGQARKNHLCIDGINCLPECPSCRFIPRMERAYRDGKNIESICHAYDLSMRALQGKVEEPFIGSMNISRARIMIEFRPHLAKKAQ